MLKYLVVEDEPIEQQALKLLLEQFQPNAEIKIAPNAQLFQNIALEWKPDFLLLDIRIPGGDGLSVLEDIKRKGFEAIVFVLSAYDNFEYAQRALSLGVFAFLVKPVSAEQLHETLNKAMEKIHKKNEFDFSKCHFQELLESNKLKEERGEDPSSEKTTSKITPSSFNTTDWILAKKQIIEGFLSGDNRQIARGESYLVDSLEQLILDFELCKMLLLGLFGELCDTLLSLQCDMEKIRHWARRQLFNLLAANSPSLFDSILRNCLEEACAIRDSLQNEQTATISLALQFIHQNFADVTLDSTANHVHVSSAHLSRLFVRVLQKRFIDVVKEKRIERAKELLMNGLSVRNVALEVGYGNIAYFSTLFKQECGISPSEYSRHSEKNTK